MSVVEPVEIRVGLGTCGVASGGRDTHEAVCRALRRSGADVTVKAVGCNGMCHREPLVELVDAAGGTVLYGHVGVAEAAHVIGSHEGARTWWRRLGRGVERTSQWLMGGGGRALRHVRVDPNAGPGGEYLAKQKRVVLENAGLIDPLSLDDARRVGAYEALARCGRELSPEDVLGCIRRAGLRGRGGAGYPTADKWDRVRQRHATTKYVLCNADEGDPGAFMDRLLIESDPHRVLEGIAIAAYAVGANEGIIYVRDEYPLAIRHVRAAIAEAEQAGLLGTSAGRHETPLKLTVVEGAGAFVCGEETAMVASIEGRRGHPRLRPPYPSDSGLWDCPTSVNNVETYACVPWIVRHGPEAFAAMGTDTSKGTKVFALAGKIRRGGLIEVPMGITIREIVEDIGGGVIEGRRLKAVQIGGPSGGCVPARLADTPIDYEALRSTGAIMGSGGLIVLDETDCLVDVARYFLEFTQAESCGKCTFCRVGTKRMLEILERLCAGQGQSGDLRMLEELAHGVTEGSLCGLGRTAPNPVLTTLRYFRDEYEAHLDGRCPAGVCRALISYTVTDRCIGCTLCAQYCPASAIVPRPYQQHEIDQDACVRCGTCRRTCPAEAIEVH